MLVLDEADEMLNKGMSHKEFICYPQRIRRCSPCQLEHGARGLKWCLPVAPGFKEQIYDVYRYLPPATQVVLISATLPHEILEMTNKFMTDPIRILVKR